MNRVIERGLVAMRELNGRGESCRRKPGSAPTAWKQAKEAEDKERVVKRSRLPAAAVKEMRCAASGTGNNTLAHEWVLL